MSNEFGYIGTAKPTQAVKSNSGVFSVNEHKELIEDEKILSFGQLELIETQTFSGVGNVDFTSIKENVYSTHFMTGIVTGNGNNRPWLRFFESGVIEEASVYQGAYQQETVGGSGENKGTSLTNLDFFVGAAESGESSVAHIYIHNAGNGAKYTTSTMQGVMSSTIRSQFGGGLLTQASVVDGFRIQSTGETTMNGVISLYGYKEYS